MESIDVGGRRTRASAPVAESPPPSGHRCTTSPNARHIAPRTAETTCPEGSMARPSAPASACEDASGPPDLALFPGIIDGLPDLRGLASSESAGVGKCGCEVLGVGDGVDRCGAWVVVAHERFGE